MWQNHSCTELPVKFAWNACLNLVKTLFKTEITSQGCSKMFFSETKTISNIQEVKSCLYIHWIALYSHAHTGRWLLEHY